MINLICSNCSCCMVFMCVPNIILGRCCQSHDLCDSPSPARPAVGGSANGVVVTGEGLNELQDPEAKQRYGYMENDKDWEEYWERYEVEQKDDDDPGKETTI